MITKREGEMLKRIDVLVGRVLDLTALLEEIDLDCQKVPPGYQPLKRCRCWPCRARRVLERKP